MIPLSFETVLHWRVADPRVARTRIPQAGQGFDKRFERLQYDLIAESRLKAILPIRGIDPAPALRGSC